MRSSAQPFTPSVRLRTVWLPGVTLAASGVVLGALAASSSTALSLAAVVALLGILGLTATSAFVTWPIRELYIVGVVVLGGLVGLPASLHVGPYSGQAVVTVGVAFIGVAIFLAIDRDVMGRLPQPVSLLIMFAAWGLVSLTWGNPTVAGVQNLLVYSGFAFTILLSYASVRTRPDSVHLVARSMTVAVILSYLLFSATLIRAGVGGNGLIASRSFGLFGLLGVAWFAAGWRCHVRWCAPLALLGVLLITLSLSRTATATAFLVAALAHTSVRRPPGLAKAILAACAAAGTAVAAVTYIPSLHSRFIHGDVRTIAGVSINVEGRTKFWSTTWNSYTTSPILGHGAGSADALISRVYGAAAAHPHNDYLRLLNDLGLVGAALWILGFVGIVYLTGHAWRAGAAVQDVVHQRIHAAACLALLAVAIAMITDNVMIYLFVMGPLGVVVGTSLGLASLGRPS